MDVPPRIDDFHVRPARKEDVEGICRIEKSCFPPDSFFLTRRKILYHLRGGKNLLAVAEKRRGGDIGGYLQALYDRRGYGWFNSLAVDPAFRGIGIAGALIDFMIGDARARGVRRLFLEVRDNHAGAISLYEKNDFVPLEVVPGYYDDGGDALKMVRDL